MERKVLMLGDGTSDSPAILAAGVAITWEIADITVLLENREASAPPGFCRKSKKGLDKFRRLLYSNAIG